MRAGSILPLGTTILSTATPQKLAKVEVFAGADAHFTVYNDNGVNYDYEKGDYKLTHLKWDEATHKFSWSGTKDWTLPESQLVTVIGK